MFWLLPSMPPYSRFCTIGISLPFLFIQIEILNKLRHPCIIQFHGVVVDRPGPLEHYIITGINTVYVHYPSSLHALMFLLNTQSWQREGHCMTSYTRKSTNQVKKKAYDGQNRLPKVILCYWVLISLHAANN